MRQMQRHSEDAQAAVKDLRYRQISSSHLTHLRPQRATVSVDWMKERDTEEDGGTAETTSPRSSALTPSSSSSSFSKLTLPRASSGTAGPPTTKNLVSVTSMSSVSEIIAGFETFDRGPAIVGILTLSSRPREDLLLEDLKAVAALQPHFFATAHFENDKFYWCRDAAFQPSRNISSLTLKSEEGKYGAERALNAYISPMLTNDSLCLVKDTTRPPWRIHLVSYSAHPSIHHMILFLSHSLGDGIDLIHALLSVGVGEERRQDDTQEPPDQLLVTPPMRSAEVDSDPVVPLQLPAPSLDQLSPNARDASVVPTHPVVRGRSKQPVRSLLPFTSLSCFLTRTYRRNSPHITSVLASINKTIRFVLMIIVKCVCWIPKYFRDFHFHDAQVSLEVKTQKEQFALPSSSSFKTAFNVSLPKFLDEGASPRDAPPREGYRRSFARVEIPFLPIKDSCRLKGVTVHDALQTAAGGAVGKYLEAYNNVRGCIAFSMRRSSGQRTTSMNDTTSSKTRLEVPASRSTLKEMTHGKSNANDFSFVVVPLETDVRTKSPEERLRATRGVMNALKHSPEPFLMAMASRIIRFLLPLPLFCRWVSWGMGHSCLVLSSLKGPTNTVFLGAAPVVGLCNFFMPMRSKLSLSFLTYKESLSICLCGNEMIGEGGREKTLQGLVDQIARELQLFADTSGMETKKN